VVIRVWLAATGGYHAGGLAVALRAASASALFAGLLLAALAVAWPASKGAKPGSEGSPSEAPHKE
ncbi:MAG: hypothetical protein HY330_05560, partial [Chloroflexi bacterium]|nr:hypothetical protein [Chloroflexota bacterium]